jgi:hypothetical protein
MQMILPAKLTFSAVDGLEFAAANGALRQGQQAAPYMLQSLCPSEKWGFQQAFYFVGVPDGI